MVIEDCVSSKGSFNLEIGSCQSSPRVFDLSGPGNKNDVQERRLKVGWLISKLFAVTFAFSIFLFSNNQVAADPVTVDDNYWVTDGTVRTIAHDSSTGTTYIGGDFSYVGPATGHGVALNTATGEFDPTFPSVNDNIDTVIPDGANGWYIAGHFTKVGNLPRRYLAHILPDKTVDPTWDPNPNSLVNALAVSDGIVYAGGWFTSIGGQPRQYIAALNATTGNATDWNADADNCIFSLAVSGNTVYAAGQFYYIGGQLRRGIAALDSTTGDVTDWNPNASDSVFLVEVSGSTVYAAGQFVEIGGQFREGIAALDAVTGNATFWNPNPDRTVITLAISGTTVYVGGNFTNIGGQPRNRIAALDISTGYATTWDPNVPNDNQYISALAISGNNIYVGGSFNLIGGQPRRSIAALDATSGKATAWNPNAGGLVASLGLSGNTLYAGGSFTSFGGQYRNHLAALTSFGKATDWNPNANGNVRTLKLVENKVYVGGDFTTIGGQTRNHIAALYVSSGNATEWDPDANSSLNALEVSGNTIYVGGLFNRIGGQDRNNIAALDAATGNATFWNPNANGKVQTLVVSGNTVYAGGNFTNIGGQPRNRIAALDISTGYATPWDPDVPNANEYVIALAASDSVVYAGGHFTNIGGQARNSIAALDVTTGNATSWDPNALYYSFPPVPGWQPSYAAHVDVLAISGNTIIAGGSFTSTGGLLRNCIAALDTSGNATAWNPSAWGPVYSLAFSPQDIYLGGQFSSVAGSDHTDFAALPNQPPTISDIPDQVVGLNQTVGPISFNVNDLESGPDSLSVSVASSNLALAPPASLKLGGSGMTRTLTITPTSGLYGSANITVTVSDGVRNASDSFFLTVNDPPVANDDTAIASPGLPVIVSVLGNDSDPDGDTLTVSALGSPSEGNASTNGTSIVYTSTNPYIGTDAFSYTVRDSIGLTDTGMITITVCSPPNNIAISGPHSGQIGDSNTFSATVSPITATQPLTYVWQATDRSPVTHSSGSLSDSISFSWGITGSKTISVTVSNGAGSATSTYLTTMDAVPPPGFKVYLPVISKNYSGGW